MITRIYFIRYITTFLSVIQFDEAVIDISGFLIHKYITNYIINFNFVSRATYNLICNPKTSVDAATRRLNFRASYILTRLGYVYICIMRWQNARCVKSDACLNVAESRRERERDGSSRSISPSRLIAKVVMRFVYFPDETGEVRTFRDQFASQGLFENTTITREIALDSSARAETIFKQSVTEELNVLSVTRLEPIKKFHQRISR